MTHVIASEGKQLSLGYLSLLHRRSDQDRCFGKVSILDVLSTLSLIWTLGSKILGGISLR